MKKVNQKQAALKLLKLYEKLKSKQNQNESQESHKKKLSQKQAAMNLNQKLKSKQNQNESHESQKIKSQCPNYNKTMGKPFVIIISVCVQLSNKLKLMI